MVEPMRIGANRPCSIEGCDRRAVARHLCNPHYLRAQRADRLGEHAVQQSKVEASCTWVGCSRPVEKRALCATHYQVWRKANPDKLHRKPANKICLIDGCEQTMKSRGWCKSHHQNWLRTGEPVLKPFVDPGCSIDGCEGRHYGKGWCQKHWNRDHRHGDPLTPDRRYELTRPRCSVQGCENPNEAFEYCRLHYRRWRRNGDPLIARKPWQPKPCSVDDCESQSRLNGMCQKHNMRLKRHGDVNAVMRKPTRFAPAQVCIEAGCERPTVSRQRCTLHYNRWNLSEDYVPTELQTGIACTVTACVNDSFASRLCATHYYRRRKYGDVLDHLPVGWMIKPPPPCSVEGCDLQQADRAVCIIHYGPKVGWTVDDPGYSATTDTSDWLAIISGDPCGYCGDPMEHIDHIHPRSQGGPDHWANFAPACQWCNQGKRVSSVLGYMLRRLGADGDLRVGAGGAPGAADSNGALAG